MRAVAIALATGLALGAAGAWWAQGKQADAAMAKALHGHALVLASIADKTAAASLAVREQEKQRQAALAQADEKHTKELKHANTETQRLRDCVRNGTCGVRIIAAPADQPGGARPPDAASSCLGNAAPALDATVSERVLDLRDAIAADQEALRYLQAYALQCRGVGDGPGP